jgi:hypothetical protein
MFTLKSAMRPALVLVIGLVFSFSSTALLAQPLYTEWGKVLDGSSDNAVSANAFTPNGQVMVAGSFVGTIDFDPLAGSQVLQPAAGKFDGFLQKLSPIGELVWAISIGGKEDDGINSMLVDAAGDVYVAGTFKDTADFDPQPLVEHLLISEGQTDGFIAKYDSGGSLLWAYQIGGTEIDQPTALAFAPDGSLYLCGNFRGTADFDPLGTSVSLSAAGAEDVFVLHLDTAAQVVGAYRFGGPNTESPADIAVHPDGKVVLCGQFQSGADFGGTILQADGPRDPFVLQLNSNGSVDWVSALHGTGGENAVALATLDLGLVWVGGNFGGTLDLDPGPNVWPVVAGGIQDAYLMLLANNGGLARAHSFGGPSVEVLADIAVDQGGDLYVCGSFGDSADLDLDIFGTQILQADGLSDGFIARYDDQGMWEYIGEMSGPDLQRGLRLGIAAGKVALSGYCRQLTDIDPGTGVINHAGDSAFASFTVLLDGATFIGSATGSLPLQVYPNPSAEAFQLVLPMALPGAELYLYDLLGRVVYARILDNAQAVTVDWQGPAGTYLLRIQHAGGTASHRIVRH